MSILPNPAKGMTFWNGFLDSSLLCIILYAPEEVRELKIALHGLTKTGTANIKNGHW